MSVVIPAYNEEERIDIMLEEAVAFLDAAYGRAPKGKAKAKAHGIAAKGKSAVGGYEILIVNDGSKDKTVDVVLAFARRNGLHDILRICTLQENRGKGGAVTHGFRHVRGARRRLRTWRSWSRDAMRLPMEPIAVSRWAAELTWWAARL
jgi:dolichyl-phosphate beta-glucosyltransferase